MSDFSVFAVKPWHINITKYMFEKALITFCSTIFFISFSSIKKDNLMFSLCSEALLHLGQVSGSKIGFRKYITFTFMHLEDTFIHIHVITT